MLIDFHTHAFADGIVERAMDRLCTVYEGMVPSTDGTADGLRSYMAQCGVDYSVVLPVATKPSQQTIINDWAAAEQGNGLFFFGTVHPDATDIEQEVERVAAMGLYGIKLHPDFQGFFSDDPKAEAIYAAAERAGLPVLFHGGVDPISWDVIHTTPAMLAEIARRHPGLTVIAAHMGGIWVYDDVVKEYPSLPNILVDCSMALRFCSRDSYLRVLDAMGPNRVLFGSDTPWSSVERELRLLQSAHLSQDEMERICWKNAAELLRLSL